jgi:coproporphyrinogen III oxidase-like Fe-S oxidoreductase
MPRPAAALARKYLLYLHIPCCAVLCPFCAFRPVRYECDNAEHYFERLRCEIELVSEAGNQFDKLYVGVGTPNVSLDGIRSVIAKVRGLRVIAAISIEPNPDDLAGEGIDKRGT